MNGFALKLIALISMLLDHTIKAGLFTQKTLLNMGMDIPSSYRLMLIIEPLGRLAFPIFAFMAAEGMRHTRSRKNYIIRLLIFGVLSEIPFDLIAGPLYSGNAALAWYAYITPFTILNVFFTLALSALGIALTEKLSAQGKLKAISWLPAAACALACLLLETDYMIFGALTVYAAYFPKKRAHQLLAMTGVMALTYLAYSSAWFTNFYFLIHGLYFIAACASIGLIALYNGKRGPNLKWLFYIAYPGHLIVLALLRSLPVFS